MQFFEALDEPLDQLRGGVGERGLEPDGGGEGGEGGGAVGRAQLGVVGGGAGVPVGVVHQGVEGLIEPLPEDHLGRGPVELQHGACVRAVNKIPLTFTIFGEGK